MKSNRVELVALATLAASWGFFGFVSPSSAVSLTIDNASFETGAPGTYSAQLPSTAGFAHNWLFACSASAPVCGSSGIAAIGFAPDGGQAGFSSNGGNVGGTSFIAQDVAPIVPGATYTFSIMVGQDLVKPLIGGYRLILGYDTTAGNPNTNVQFQNTLFFAPGDIPDPGEFILATITGVAPLGATGNVTIAFGSGSYALWDEASLIQSQVPLPPAVALFATGLAGLGWVARRRKKQGRLVAL